ncbi:MAG: hypothetical protein ACYCOU_16730 [Sulfobacillus sp.]
MSSKIVYEFDEPSIGQFFAVAVARNCRKTEEQIWLDFVARRFPTADMAWLAYSERMPPRVRLFGEEDQALFDLTMEKQVASGLTVPDYGELSVRRYSASEMKARKQASRRAAVQHGAAETVKRVQTVLDTVVPMLDSVSFASQSGMNALRLGLQQASTPSAASSGDGSESKQKVRRKKRPLFARQKMPVPPTIPKQRKRRADELKQRTDIGYLIRDEHDRVVSVGSCPNEANDLVGLVFDVKQQFARARARPQGRRIGRTRRWRRRSQGAPEAAAFCGADRGRHDTEQAIHPLRVAGRVRPRSPSFSIRPLAPIACSDGVSARKWRARSCSSSKQGAFGFPQLQVRIVCLRVLVILFQSLTQPVVCFGVCSVQANGWLLQILLQWMAMDHKAKNIELALQCGGHDFRCGPCACPAPRWLDGPAVFSFPERSVLQLAELYMGSLLDTLTFIRNARDRPDLKAKDKYLKKSTGKHGVHRFPAVVVANSAALGQLLVFAARHIGLPELVSASPAQLRSLEQTFAEALLLDAQVNRTLPVNEGAVPGFPIDGLFSATAILHCIKGSCCLCSVWPRGLPERLCCPGLGHALCELGIASHKLTSSAAAVERALIAAAGGHVKSLSDHCFAYHFRMIFSDANAFLSCSRQFQQSARVSGLLFVLCYLQKLSMAQRAVLAGCAVFATPIVKALLARLPDGGSELSLAKPTLYLHSWTHLPGQIARFEGPLVDVAEETVERFVGHVQKQIQQRGAHDNRDLIRELQSTEQAEEAKVALSLPTRKPSRAVRAEHKHDSDLNKGLVVCGPALALDEIRAAFAYVQQQLPPAYHAHFADRDRALFVCESPPADSSFAWRDVNRTNFVLCFCDGDSCVHVA